MTKSFNNEGQYGGSDSDEGTGLYEKDASNGLSSQKMKAKIDRTHPRSTVMENGVPVYKKWSIFGTHTGYFSYNKSWRKSDMQEYGIGIVLYFQFLKYLGCVFFLLTLLSLPSMYLFYKANPVNSVFD